MPKGSEERLSPKGSVRSSLQGVQPGEWPMANGFPGTNRQQVLEMTPEIVAGITDRYIELSRKDHRREVRQGRLSDTRAILNRIEKNVSECLKGLK